jgi:hypothetical protein
MPKPIKIPIQTESGLFAATLDTGATDGAGAALELVFAATTAPHSWQNRASVVKGLPHVTQKLFIVVSN